MTATPGPSAGDPDGQRAPARLPEATSRGSGFAAESVTPPLREAVATAGVGWYPLVALGLLVIVDQFQEYAVLVLGPEISATLGIGKESLAALAALQLLALSAATLPMAAWVQHKPRRAMVCVVTAAGWSVMTLASGFVTNVWGLLAVLVAGGASSGSVAAVHPPLLVDSYPPEVRVRTLAAYQGTASLGGVVSPLLVGVLTALAGFTWRGVFVVMGVTCLVATAASAWLRDPGFSRWDSGGVPRATADDVEQDFLGDRGPELRFFESVHRLFAIPTVRRVLVANAVLGTALIPLFTFLFFFLAARWGMGPGARGLFYAVLSGFAIAGVALFGSRAERLFWASPPQLVRLAAAALGLGVVSLALGAFSPFFFGVVVLFGVAAGLLSVVTPALNAVLLSVVPVRLRPHASALAGVFFSAVGGLGGLVLLSGLDRRYGTAGAMAAVAIPGLISAWVLSGAAGSVERDLERLVEEAVDEKDATVARAGGAHLPLVVCRRLDFSYGDHQVLFGVDFRVEEGEAVAVVGTNGAGKSTLLRVMAGLELPQSGSVRVEGRDVTYLGVERRLALGIVTIVGTRSLFPSLSVVENLRLFAYTTSASSRSCRAAADRALEALPALASARDKPAATLSGGQQRLLALARAFVLSPRLLLVDELASGLAPVALADVLGALGQLRASGTSMVVVEQSLAVAAAIADRACFLDGGRIRFDGKPADLLARHDLIRPLFLPPATRDPRLPPAPQRR